MISSHSAELHKGTFPKWEDAYRLKQNKEETKMPRKKRFIKYKDHNRWLNEMYTQYSVQEKLNKFMEFNKKYMHNPTPEQEKFARETFQYLLTNNDTSKVDIFPARCGIGKSQFIKTLIDYCTDEAELWGDIAQAIPIVVITDNLTRLEEYNSRYCAFITSQITATGIEQILQSQEKPIVLLTTQRFAKLDENQLEILFKFKPEKDTLIDRKYLFIDERPTLFTKNIIDIQALCDVETAISNIARINTKQSKAGKQFAEDTFKQVKDKITDFFKDDEKTTTKKASYYFYQPEQLFTDYETKDKFLHYINKQNIQSEMKSNKVDSVNTINCIDDINENGCFYQSKRKTAQQDYKRQFEVIINNIDKFQLGKGKFKTIVFDATADIDSTYFDTINLRYIPTQSRRSDEHLNLHYIPIPANKARLNNTKNMLYLRMICRYLKEQFPKDDNYLLITYQPVVDIIKANNLLPAYFKLAYFGNLKGTNDYRGYTKVIQLGFNRFSDFDYFVNAMILDESKIKQKNEWYKMFDMFDGLSETETQNIIDSYTQQRNGNYTDESMQEVFVNSVLTDFEQNIFRSAIRDANNDKRVDIYMIWGDNYKDTINQAIENRYKDIIDEWDKPSFVDEYKTRARQTQDQKQTIPQKILQWLQEQPIGKEFKTADILQDLKINDKQFQKAKKNTTVKSRLSDYQSNKKGYYKKLP